MTKQIMIPAVGEDGDDVVAEHWTIREENIGQ